MERSTTAMKTLDCNLTPKTTTLRDRDASFSSYLTPEKPITSQCQPHQHQNHHQTNGSGLCRIALDDSTTEELSIFDAHKYFNEVTTNNDSQKVSISGGNSRVSPMETERIVPRYSSASSSVDGYANIRNYRARSFHAATPTASSEASWNSQTGLLSHPPGAMSISMKNPPNPNSTHLNNNNLKTSLSKPIWLLRRKCPCGGKKSVQVKENKTSQPKNQTNHENKPKKTINMETVHNHITVTPNNWVMDKTPPPPPTTTTTLAATKSQRLFPPHQVVTTLRAPFNDGFTFPIPNGVVEEDPPRDSLEVFRPPDIEPKPLNFPFKTTIEDDGDGASDASSDLFEIESFSTTTQSTYPIMCRRSSRDSFEEGSTMTECYEPSEASIEWSVTTAEGYDENGGSGGGGTAVEQWKKKGGKNNGLLVSCRCEKAVSVGPQPVKCGTTTEGATIGTTWRHVSVMSGNNSSSGSNSRVIGSVNKPPLARSHHRNNNTPRVSLAFTT